MGGDRLGDLTWTELGRKPDLVLAVPVGSTEQHGPHLPLSTDTDVALALAGALAERREDVLVGPPVAYTSSGEHRAFPGTLSIGAQATELLLVELGRSAAATARRLLLVSAHGGNAEPVARAVRRLRGEGCDVLAWWPRWHGDAHAGRTETSVQLALDPDRVRSGAAAAGNVRELAALMPVLRREGVRAVSPNGVLGDPTGASAEEGARLIAAATDDLSAAVAAWVGR
jgi:mycofactocin precursor peptide peptidase